MSFEKTLAKGVAKRVADDLDMRLHQGFSELYELLRRFDPANRPPEPPVDQRDGHTRLQIFDETLPDDPDPTDKWYTPEMRRVGVWVCDRRGRNRSQWREHAADVREKLLLETACYLVCQEAGKAADKDLLGAAHRLYNEQIPGTPEFVAKDEKEQAASQAWSDAWRKMFALSDEERDERLSRMIMDGAVDDAVIRRFNQLTLDKAIEAGAEAEKNEAFKDAPFRPDSFT